jgi:tetratricopeptide (TPR) repeat protein
MMSLLRTLKAALHSSSVIGTFALLGVVLSQSQVNAQHAIEVQRLHSTGKFLESLVEYDRIPKRRVTVDAVVAAGKSAWALGLPSRALQEFDTALRKRGLDSIQQGEILLSEGIIHFQEGESEVAISYAERSLEIVPPPHILRSRALLLSAEALTRLGRHAEALAESSLEDRHNALYGLGTVRMNLGKTVEAREAFEAIPTESDHAAQSVRHLAEIALRERNFKRAYQWLVKGQREHAEFFLDSWVQYALVRCAVAQHQLSLVEDLQRVANERFPQSDGWITLLNAEAESLIWSQSAKVEEERGRN